MSDPMMTIEHVDGKRLQLALLARSTLYQCVSRYICLKMKEVPLRDHSGGRPKCSHPLKSVEELTGVVVVIMLGGVISGILPTTFGIRWLLTFSLVDPVNQVLLCT
ncbi:hypothetical protein BDB01DRAFT_892898 [Pilobolus umbonatus]|nr:hypothetical protein BDB01DRAFT_892898 [Pilobolus umbonatus]